MQFLPSGRFKPAFILRLRLILCPCNLTVISAFCLARNPPPAERWNLYFRCSQDRRSPCDRAWTRQAPERGAAISSGTSWATIRWNQLQLCGHIARLNYTVASFPETVATIHGSTIWNQRARFTHPDNPLAFLVGFTALSSHLQSQLKTTDWTTKREIIRTPWFRGLRLDQPRFRLSSGYQAEAAPESLEPTVFTLSMV
jgi:hypothetical protein